jgi:hypothetical protein
MQVNSTVVKHVLTWVMAALALGAVFLAYLRPEFIVDLANQIWLCF